MYNSTNKAKTQKILLGSWPSNPDNGATLITPKGKFSLGHSFQSKLTPLGNYSLTGGPKKCQSLRPKASLRVKLRTCDTPPSGELPWHKPQRRGCTKIEVKSEVCQICVTLMTNKHKWYHSGLSNKRSGCRPAYQVLGWILWLIFQGGWFIANIIRTRNPQN